MLYPFFSLTRKICVKFGQSGVSREQTFPPREPCFAAPEKKFPDQKPEKRSRPEEVTSEDVLWNSVAHNRAKNRSQASNVMKATGSRGVNCFMLLPNHDRPNQAFPDMMHDVKNIVCAFFELFIGKGDSVKWEMLRETWDDSKVLGLWKTNRMAYLRNSNSPMVIFFKLYYFLKGFTTICIGVTWFQMQFGIYKHKKIFLRLRKIMACAP